MASPFPGMDPYIEHPGRWPDFHARFIGALCDELSLRLRPRYLVRIDERVYISDETEDHAETIVPDGTVVSTVSSSVSDALPSSIRDAPDPSTAPILIAAPSPQEHREVFLVVKLPETLDVVTIIELLSPSNKRPNSSGQREYLGKRTQLLRSEHNLVEFDFLRGGARLPMAKRLPVADYFVFVHREWRRPMCELFPFTLRDSLPTIPIPLSGREETEVALQPLMDGCYERAGYDMEIDYTMPPIPPLADADAVWAAERTATNR